MKLSRITRAQAMLYEGNMPATVDEAFRRSLEGLQATDLSALRAVLADAMRLQVLRRMQGTVRHDFVSPLQATALTFDLLRRQLQLVATDEQRRNLTRLIDAGKAELDRFKSAISNVADGLAASERDQRFDVRKTVDELRLWMQNEAAFLDLQLEVRGADELWISSRREEVRQLIAIIMLYALDALSAGGKLTVELQREQTAAHIRLVAEGVREPGRWGPKMFEPNWSEPRLPGLGLCVALWTAADLGGNIEVEVPATQNAELQLRLPGPL